MSEIILFYMYTTVQDPVATADWQRRMCTELGLLGRVRIAAEGINGNLAGTEAMFVTATRKREAAYKYIERMNSLEHPDASGKRGLFAGIDYKFTNDPADRDRDLQAFHSLSVVLCDELCVGGKMSSVKVTSPAAMGDEAGAAAASDLHLTPAEFHAALEKAKDDPDSLILDVRNAYETAVGYFDGAFDPKLRTFAQLPEWFSQNAAALKAKKQVLMYCTGGIRCEKAAVYFQKHGCQNVKQLQGGIHKYLDEFPGAAGHFLGKNFVFDERLGVCPLTTPSAALPSPRPTLAEAESIALSHAAAATDASSSSSPADSAPRDGQATAPTIVGHCVMCAVPYDTHKEDIVCSICKSFILVCPECHASACATQPPTPLFCAEHFLLQDDTNIRTHFLSRFSLEELKSQRAQLLRIIQSHARRTNEKEGKVAYGRNRLRNLNAELTRLSDFIAQRWPEQAASMARPSHVQAHSQAAAGVPPSTKLSLAKQAEALLGPVSDARSGDSNVSANGSAASPHPPRHSSPGNPVPLPPGYTGLGNSTLASEYLSPASTGRSTASSHTPLFSHVLATGAAQSTLANEFLSPASTGLSEPAASFAISSPASGPFFCTPSQGPSPDLSSGSPLDTITRLSQQHDYLYTSSPPASATSPNTRVAVAHTAADIVPVDRAHASLNDTWAVPPHDASQNHTATAAAAPAPVCAAVEQVIHDIVPLRPDHPKLSDTWIVPESRTPLQQSLTADDDVSLLSLLPQHADDDHERAPSRQREDAAASPQDSSDKSPAVPPPLLPYIPFLNV